MKVYVKYGFIFTPDETWRHKSQFESDLGAYFLSKGYSAEIIKTPIENREEIMVLLKKIDVQPTPTPPKETKKDLLKNVEKMMPTGKAK